MWKRLSTRSIAIGCLVIGLIGGVVGTTVAQGPLRTVYLNTGLFTIQAHEEARFFVSLDDRPNGAPATVRLVVLDRNGDAVKREQAVLAAGDSTMVSQPGPGLFRVHAEVLDTSLSLSARRSAAASLEVLDLTTNVSRPPTCSIDQGLPPPR